LKAHARKNTHGLNVIAPANEREDDNGHEQDCQTP
jgi:hypothetical protein